MYSKTGSYKIDFDKVDWNKLHSDLLKIAGSQVTLDEIFEKMKNESFKRKSVRMSKCKTTTKTIYTSNTLNIITRNGEIEIMPPKKLNVGSKADESKEPEQPEQEQSERTIEDTEATWLSMSKNGKAIFVTIPVDDLNKIEIQEYTKEDGEKVEQVQLVTSVESIERVLSKAIKGTKLGYFKTK